MFTKDTWEDVKLLCPPIIWFGISAYVWKLLFLPLVLNYWPIFVANFALWIIFLTAVCKVWWYEGKYSGNQINVREPLVGWEKMKYDVDPSELGVNTFSTVFFWHFSSVVIPMEACIHMFMGSDLQRASLNGDNSHCMGMMAQEMNHGTAQLFYQKAAEQCCGFPEGFRLLWKTLLLKVASSKLRAAVLTWIEVSFFVPEMMVYLFPIKPHHIFGEPKWLWTWHLMEESEHSWDYTSEMGKRISWFYMATIWTIFVPFTSYVWVMSVIQGVYYGFWTFAKHPTRIVTATLFHFTVFVQVIMAMLALSLLEMVLGMRPDKIYGKCCSSCREEFSEYKHLFKITHKQSPSEPLKKFVNKGGHPSRKSILSVQAGRESLYEKVRDMMTTYGMSEKQIRRTSFNSAVEANKHNPLLE